jgi:AcrR family transcriptional regulator
MPRKRAAGYDNQRETIIEQAAALFARNGFVGTSMNEVALACGLSKASLYHYYTDKHQLLMTSAKATSTACALWSMKWRSRTCHPSHACAC